MSSPASSPPSARLPRALQHALRAALREMLVVKGPTPLRWAFSLRAAAAIGGPLCLGVWAGDYAAGSLASLGAFTGLYGSGRPYLYRAGLLGAVALALASFVGLGAWVAAWKLATVLVLVCLSMLTVWVCSALQVGPPGAYTMMLACSVATSMPTGHLSAFGSAVLVFAGGAWAWLLHMAMAPLWSRAPEKLALTMAARGVCGYLDAVGTSDEDAARHQAAMSMHNAWVTLINQQPWPANPHGTLARLRQLNRELHLIFAECMDAVSRGDAPPKDARARAMAIGASAGAPPPSEKVRTGDELPLGNPGPWVALREALGRGSLTRLVVLRVGVASAACSVVGMAFQLERSYWVVSTAVLLLHVGLDFPRTVQRGLERTSGTLLGVGLAALLLTWQPQGYLLVATVMALQFAIEMLILRNYTSAVVAVTGLALLLASGGRPVADLSGFVAVRAIDTVVGCGVALCVVWLLPPVAVAQQLPVQLERSVLALSVLLPWLERGEVSSRAAREARREVQTRVFALAQAYEVSLGAPPARRREAEQLSPLIAATQRLSYRALSACWGLERLGPEAAQVAGAQLFVVDGAAGASALHHVLAEIADAIRHHGPRPLLDKSTLPPFLREEVAALVARMPSRPESRRSLPVDGPLRPA